MKITIILQSYVKALLCERNARKIYKKAEYYLLGNSQNCIFAKNKKNKINSC